MLLWTLGSLYLFEFSARNLNIISNPYQNFSLRKPSPWMVDFCLETWFMYLFLQFPLPLCKNRRTLAKWSRAWILESDGQSCLTLCDPMDCSMPTSLSITNSRSLLKLMSIELVMPSDHLILYRPFLLLPSIFPSIRIFPKKVGSLHQVVKVLEFQLQHQSFQWIFRTDFL